MQPGNKTCIIGATYEHQYQNDQPNLEQAALELLPKAAALYPPIDKAQVLLAKAALRVTTPNHLPLVAKISPKEWIITGLGSKGLLYHGLYAKKLAQLIYHSFA
jgi:glycine/D-amino acid oxidase-like deaminating enzyme